MSERSFALAPLAILDVSPPKQVICAAEAGFTHLELRILAATATEAIYPMIGDTPMVRETMRNIQLTGIKILNAELIRLLPDTRAVNYIPFFETAAMLGSPNVMVAGNDPDFNRSVDNFAQLCELAAPYNLCLNLEFTPWSSMRNIQDTMAVIHAANRANSACMIDTLHFDRGGSSIDDLELIPEGALRFMQLCDGMKQKPKDVSEMLYQARAYRLVPGQGGIENLAELMLALPRDLPISLEVVNEEFALHLSPIARSRQFLQQTKAWLKSIGAD